MISSWLNAFHDMDASILQNEIATVQWCQKVVENDLTCRKLFDK